MVRIREIPRETLLRPAEPLTHFASMGQGLVGLQVLGKGNSPEAVATADWLAEVMQLDPAAQRVSVGGWPFLGTFLLGQAFRQFDPIRQRTARQFIERNFVVGQSSDGSWTDGFEGRHVGRVYCTSLAMITLATKDGRLPLYTP